MRLLKLDEHGQLELTEDFVDNVPSYAILSHTWGADEEEVTFDDVRTGAGKSKARAREQLRDLMTDIRLQAEFFLDDVTCFPVKPEPNVRVVPLRLFSNFVGGLLRSMLIADKAYGRLNHAFEAGELSEENYRAYSRNFEMSWSAIKAYLNNGQSDQSAQELGAAQGIA